MRSLSTAHNPKRGLFKNVPNLELRGNTYDVRHLDKFINYDNQRQAFLS
jgi:hypothetical protein